MINAGPARANRDDAKSAPADADVAESAAEDADVVESFVRHRDLLFTIAYEITGSVADAEDVVQETYLRWSERPNADETGHVRNSRAYLARIATRLALNSLRGRSRRREDYVGPWLPEPLVTTPDVADDVLLAESVSMAMMLVTERLSPDERAVFVLREVFGFDYDEIAQAVGKSAAAARQVAHRARSAVQAHRPRYPTDAPAARAVAEKFMSAAVDGDLQGLLDVLAPDVVLLADGGGVKSAPARPVHSADKVARLLVGLREKGAANAEFRPAVVNGMLGMLGYADGALDTVAALDVADGRVRGIYLVRNPEKLRRIETLRTVTR
jgi:RNA polymerase sigma-70 factor, ECF subfamily